MVTNRNHQIFYWLNNVHTMNCSTTFHLSDMYRSGTISDDKYYCYYVHIVTYRMVPTFQTDGSILVKETSFAMINLGTWTYELSNIFELKLSNIWHAWPVIRVIISFRPAGIVHVQFIFKRNAGTTYSEQASLVVSQTHSQRYLILSWPSWSLFF